jgi:Na+-driven multidrug efflux pump
MCHAHAITYWKKSPVAASLRQLTDFDRIFFGKVIKPMSPVIFNELFWALGITTYNVIYGRMGTASFAAMSIVSTVEQLAFVFFIGISNATSVLVGNRIGAGKENEAYIYAGRSSVIFRANGFTTSRRTWMASNCLVRV